ncbi:MAG: acetoacetate metabolism regulatory protein AtoC [Candidatus Methanofastidiosum methylothiophilum]|uniref:Acetoacetate metabolism regulatory protein AtoC n=1 Tax=Candidatus Methanofastidiosum methylothiophilum TaxID=1705564 RepID=A0A150IYF9_9EURY|nr:MAG: acetoacetate metabolism regulatory protein AtoC [Candidatus Methanofastidiosum methylthiophilus]KYC47375.1 MAG: acetoacetate metabolism regulatory protein AtoC [Candidatus Methanofastidiosum methylthiophilus]KYC49868.1 MAG: acetoacetate metabolism regulatory protein AtoC [Candidatus Methanofastidiosum methylthiophilus]
MVKILLVDDNQDFLDILKQGLSEHEVFLASNGLEGVETYKKVMPDVVVMDLKMPVMDGIRATKEILKINPSAIIVGGTAYTELQKDLFDAGAMFVLIKPFSIDSIEKIIEKYVLKKRPKTGYYK